MPDYNALGLHAVDNLGDNNFFILNSTQEIMKDKYNFDIGIKNNNELISVDNDCTFCEFTF